MEHGPPLSNSMRPFQGVEKPLSKFRRPCHPLRIEPATKELPGMHGRGQPQHAIILNGRLGYLPTNS